MLHLKDNLKTNALKLTPHESLASNCPRCFGPSVEGKHESEPDFIVFLDGNSQHRRHTAASAGWRGEPALPSIFLPQDSIDKWDDRKKKTDYEQEELLNNPMVLNVPPIIIVASS